MPEHELLEDFEGAGAVFPGGVDVAADVEVVLGDVVAGQAPADLVLCFQGADSALRDVAGRPYGRVGGEARHVGFPVPAGLRHIPAGLLLHGGPRPGRARHRRRAGRDGAAEIARLAWMSRGLAVKNRWLPGLERGYDGIVVGAYARHDALRLQGQSPVQDVVVATPPGVVGSSIAISARPALANSCRRYGWTPGRSILKSPWIKALSRAGTSLPATSCSMP